MSNSCRPKELLRSEHGVIVRCDDCKHVGVIYKNMILNFQPEDFLHFAKNMNLISFEDEAKLFADKVHRVIINSCHDDIRLTFDEGELLEVQEMLLQAKLLLEVNEVLYDQ